MKTKIIVLSALISVLSLTVANTQSAMQSKASLKKSSSTAVRVNKGLAMEDRNQFSNR